MNLNLLAGHIYNHLDKYDISGAQMKKQKEYCFVYTIEKI